jgi:hypothetical protein
MTTRPADPQFLLDYRQWMKSGPPKCCHTCEHFSQEGHCSVFDMRPPGEFADEVDGCDQWELEVPF